MSHSEDARETLRALGMRVTPQRRAILAAFRGGRTEHLSAEEVYAYAAQVLPELSRGTVYATLAEFAENGLLSASGTPEPVRYETNTAPHAHFRCRLCLRLFDLEGNLQDPQQITAPGFKVERVETRVEGVCEDCIEYEKGLMEGARSIRRSGPPTDALSTRGAASMETATPFGPLMLAASPRGLLRVAFEEHADAQALRAHAAGRRGSQAARGHLIQAREQLNAYFAGEAAVLECAIDWEQLQQADAATLQATRAIPYAGRRSYTALGIERPAREIGWIMGANPIAIVAPCHRVTRGTHIPTVFVGGPDRRRWLQHHEHQHAA
jgi:Fe2+ or Zn2+ uptake regulation protein/O6-methylguanine-DNA--protein-cysteine methyltransferase